MGRRHDALIPLTHDHHHALHQARVLRAAADADDDERRSAARVFVTFFREHSVPHFREEEEEIFPLVVGLSGAPLDGISRIVNEHIVIHWLVKEIERQGSTGAPEPEVMRTLADALRDHVRFEEDVVFPAVERVASDQLARIKLAERTRGS